MAYPSIISQPGSADRNYSPISEALRPWINEAIASSSTSPDSSLPPDGGARTKIFEIGSYPYAHIKRFANDFGDVEWHGSGRDEWEVNEIKKQENGNGIANLHDPVQLDIAQDDDWIHLRNTSLSRGDDQSHHPSTFDGVVMLNVIHCCPEGTPEHVFRQLSHATDDGSTLLKQGGWIAVYGPFLADDGTHKSTGDEEFDRTYIKARDPRLGLRTIGSITAYAEKWGFEEVERKEMPKGNMWVVWRLSGSKQVNHLNVKQAISLAYVDTELSADCIEFCPFEGYQHFFVCGTYQVLAPETKEPVTKESDASDDEDEVTSGPSQTRRTGRLLLFTVTEDETEVQRISTPAILDAKWCPKLDDDLPQLAVGDAMGHVTIYSLSKTGLTKVRSIEVAEEKILCLSLDYVSTGDALIVSLSSGHLAHVPLGDNEDIQSFSAHMYEPWITSFDKGDESGMTVWSGGDDCVLKKWDLGQTFRPSLVNKQFEAGVTTITFSPHTPYLMAVGSYDCTLRLFDSRSPKTPLLQIEVGGGVWRTKFHPDRSRRAILLATMHDGFKVVELSERLTKSHWEELGEQDAQITTRFDGHDSLAYGVDWCRLPPKNGKSLVVSCSFYDHAMHLWRE